MPFMHNQLKHTVVTHTGFTEVDTHPQTSKIITHLTACCIDNYTAPVYGVNSH